MHGFKKRRSHSLMHGFASPSTHDHGKFSGNLNNHDGLDDNSSIHLSKRKSRNQQSHHAQRQTASTRQLVMHNLDFLLRRTMSHDAIPEIKQAIHMVKPCKQKQNAQNQSPSN